MRPSPAFTLALCGCGTPHSERPAAHSREPGFLDLLYLLDFLELFDFSGKLEPLGQRERFLAQGTVGPCGKVYQFASTAQVNMKYCAAVMPKTVMFEST